VVLWHNIHRKYYGVRFESQEKMSLIRAALKTFCRSLAIAICEVCVTEMIMELELTPVGVWILNRSQYYMLVVVKQNGINWDVFSDQWRHISQKCDTGWEYRAFHHQWWFQSYGPCKIQCVSDNAVQELRNPCSSHENVGLIMRAKAQDTKKTVVNKSDYKQVTVCRNDLQHSDRIWRVRSNVQ